LHKFVLPEEFKLSKRLGISYTGLDNKFLISNDIDTFIRKEINENNLKFTYKIENLDSNYSKIIFTVPSKNFSREYYFKDSSLISQPYYYARNWKQIKSKFFIFHASDPGLFNGYSENKLDNFVENILIILKCSDKQINKLKENKINYYLCKDDNEIKMLTNYDARGLYYLPYDYIITTYNCHYHEILHLLINYKLQTIPLYTLPLLQEGFAVAFGGRGGKEPDVILEMGSFLEKNNFLDYNSLLSKQDFFQADVSLSYPAAGLYNKFLLSELGIDKYLILYRKYSGVETEIDNFIISLNDLPPENKWKSFLNNYSDSNAIKININGSANYKEIAENKSHFIISENSDYYRFQIKDTLLVSANKKINNYKSKLFGELYPGKKYQFEKYAIIADSNEVSVYNLYSNNLIAKYVRSFSSQNKKVSRINNLHQFLIRKKIFDESLGELKFN